MSILTHNRYLGRIVQPLLPETVNLGLRAVTILSSKPYDTYYQRLLNRLHNAQVDRPRDLWVKVSHRVERDALPPFSMVFTGFVLSFSFLEMDSCLMRAAVIKPVAQAAHGEQMARLVRIHLDFVAQARGMHPEQAPFNLIRFRAGDTI